MEAIDNVSKIEKKFSRRKWKWKR